MKMKIKNRPHRCNIKRPTVFYSVDMLLRGSTFFSVQKRPLELIWKVWNCSATREATRIYHVYLCLLLIITLRFTCNNLVKYLKILKYFDHGCRSRHGLKYNKYKKVSVCLNVSLLVLGLHPSLGINNTEQKKQLSPVDQVVYHHKYRRCHQHGSILRNVICAQNSEFSTTVRDTSLIK